ncbi:mannose-1-phosphate guanylyltransferase/mannose-6-phosphate isomerase [Helicobacter jaachi]|uniref:mannose-1-phosphate guanylyltransferase n=1 Tax=Helicobacter jaachi TaxID=1677920 RepID=A0A4U8TCD9_9HELI|nr:mannose-1-phosphate guanylyltransferase/mannose-6-phosphate isomerase [Helicobacter jaachi]TLD97334.1 mannose-1-phosphate guanylyltransferase/mannose-6-phosphate isomerase [Helicobacter jaachi]
MTISILCGGSGTRLFPLSRELLPKQFAAILPPLNAQTPSHSLFQETLLRNQFLCDTHNAHFQIITNENHYFIAQEQAHQCHITLQDFILESIGKNTAPALTFAALKVASEYELGRSDDDIILALPSDHLIKDSPAYRHAIEEALNLAQKGFLVTFGIKPTSAHTGYGYIKSKNHLVEKFIEKPSLDDAQMYLNEGGYLWNSGMFCMRAQVFLKELKAHSPEVYESCKLTLEASKAQLSEHFIRLDSIMSKNLPEISIDYALMEKSQKVACVEGDFVWSDVGSFESLSLEYPSDEQNNASKNTFIGKDCSNNFIIADKLVAGIGLEDLMIIDESDCLLVAKKGHSQQIKDIVATLKHTHSEITKVHKTAHRPWGSYTVLLESQSYKIKQIIVKPKARLSLQKHYHRNEHWIVVSGSAYVSIGEQKSFLKANQSTYIPMGELHRLENPGVLPLVLIEVQMGEYLGEDDIVRLSDDYKRH